MEDVELCPFCGAVNGKCREDAMLRSGEGGGVRIVRLTDERGPMHTLTEETYVNRDSTKVVPAGHVDAAWLLGMAGDEISDETAKRLGLSDTTDGPSSKYAGMKVPELEAEIAGRDDVDEPASGRKADLIAALEAADAKGNAGTADQGAAEATDGVAQAENPAEA